MYLINIKRKVYFFVWQKNNKRNSFGFDAKKKQFKTRKKAYPQSPDSPPPYSCKSTGRPLITFSWGPRLNRRPRCAEARNRKLVVLYLLTQCEGEARSKQHGDSQHHDDKRWCPEHVSLSFYLWRYQGHWRWRNLFNTNIIVYCLA